MEWRSVDDYPPAGQRVLVAGNDNSVGIGFWNPEEGWMLEGEMGDMDCEPLYWMPLPAHPDAAAKTSETAYD